MNISLFDVDIKGLDIMICGSNRTPAEGLSQVMMRGGDGANAPFSSKQHIRMVTRHTLAIDNIIMSTQRS